MYGTCNTLNRQATGHFKSVICIMASYCLRPHRPGTCVGVRTGAQHSAWYAATTAHLRAARNSQRQVRCNKHVDASHAALAAHVWRQHEAPPLAQANEFTQFGHATHTAYTSTSRRVILFDVAPKVLRDVTVYVAPWCRSQRSCFWKPGLQSRMSSHAQLVLARGGLV